MSIVSLGNTTGVLGVPLALVKGADDDRTAAQLDAARHHWRAAQRAEAAAGIGEPDGDDFAAADREPDGRRSWKDRALPGRLPIFVEPRSKDPTRQSGNLLDVNG